MFSIVLALAVIYLLVKQQDLIDEVRRYNQNHPKQLARNKPPTIEADEVIPPDRQ